MAKFKKPENTVKCMAIETDDKGANWLSNTKNTVSQV